MEIFEIHDNSNCRIRKILENEFSKIPNSSPYMANYHPFYSGKNSNIFYLLTNGRYEKGNGKYYIIFEGDQYVASAGWNKYEYEENVVLLLTRMFVKSKYRNHFYIGKYVLPLMIKETKDFYHLWITCNEYNKNIYNWFDRSSKKQSKTISNQWPEIYKNFYPIGKKQIYFTEQLVVEYNK